MSESEWPQPGRERLIVPPPVGFSGTEMANPEEGSAAHAMIAPYVDEEIAWAVRYHQALRYFADESVGNFL